MTPAALCAAGMAFGGIDVPFVWQAWHLVTSTCGLRGKHGSYGTGLGVVVALCVAGVALGDIDVPFAWQAWH